MNNKFQPTAIIFTTHSDQFLSVTTLYRVSQKNFMMEFFEVRQLSALSGCFGQFLTLFDIFWHSDTLILLDSFEYFWALWALLGTFGHSEHFWALWAKVPREPKSAPSAQKCRCLKAPRVPKNVKKCPKRPKVPRMAKKSCRTSKDYIMNFFWDTL